MKIFAQSHAAAFIIALLVWIFAELKTGIYIALSLWLFSTVFFCYLLYGTSAIKSHRVSWLVGGLLAVFSGLISLVLPFMTKNLTADTSGDSETLWNIATASALVTSFFGYSLLFSDIRVPLETQPTEISGSWIEFGKGSTLPILSNNSGVCFYIGDPQSWRDSGFKEVYAKTLGVNDLGQNPIEALVQMTDGREIALNGEMWSSRSMSDNKDISTAIICNMLSCSTATTFGTIERIRVRSKIQFEAKRVEWYSGREN